MAEVPQQIQTKMVQPESVEKPVPSPDDMSLSSPTADAGSQSTNNPQQPRGPEQQGGQEVDTQGITTITTTATVTTAVTTIDKNLETALQQALDSQDLGKLCKILGDNYCLPSRAPTSVIPAVDDAASDTTPPAIGDSATGSGVGASADDCGPSSDVERFRGHGATDAAVLGSNVKELAEAVGISADVLRGAWDALFSWRQALAMGDLLDVFNTLEQEWYLAKVLCFEDKEEGDGNGATLEKDEEGSGAVGTEDGEGQQGEKRQKADGRGSADDLIQIHYQGWPSKFDETFRRDSPSLQPVHTYTKRPKKKATKAKRKEIMEWIRTDELGNVVARGIVGQDDPYEDRETVEKESAEAPAAESVTTNRFGRKLVTRVELPTPRSKGKARAKGSLEDGESGTGTNADADGDSDGAGGDGGSKDEKRTNRSKDGGSKEQLHADEICSTCEQFDTPCLSDMITCDGPCLRSFHVSCLDLDEQALSEDKWICEDCERSEHPCWQCGDYGQDNVMGGVFRCMAVKCGRFYHRHCIELNPNAQIKQDLDEGDDGHPVFKFRCSYHMCDTCNNRVSGKNHLYQCFKCPVAFHLNCIPPDAQYHELALLCSGHPEDELPKLNKGDGNESGKEAQEPSDGDPAVGSCRLPDFKLPKHPPRADNPGDVRHFRLPTSILTSYHSKPSPFQHICALHWVAPKPIRVEPEEVCTCTDGCGDSCLNYMLKTECVCGNGIKAKYQNCKQGPNCGNRRLQEREVAKVAAFREHGMGWGLKLAQDVQKNALIGEYVGEVIDEATMEHRMSEQRRLRPYDGEFYMMELMTNLFIDAKNKGNLMRLINHSCNPNCDVQAWNVAGHTRLGIFAKENLPAGTGLSYDYKFSTNETAKFRCMCGADNCRGTLAPKVREEEVAEDGSKLKGKARREMLQKREKAARFRQARNQQGQKETYKRLALTGRLLPGDRTAEVKAGPPSKYFGFARDQRLFLVRNARAGADLLTRKRMLVSRGDRQPKEAALGSASSPLSPRPAWVNEVGGSGSDVCSASAAPSAAVAAMNVEGEPAEARNDANGTAACGAGAGQATGGLGTRATPATPAPAASSKMPSSQTPARSGARRRSTATPMNTITSDNDHPPRPTTPTSTSTTTRGRKATAHEIPTENVAPQDTAETPARGRKRKGEESDGRVVPASRGTGNKRGCRPGAATRRNSNAGSPVGK